MTALGANAPLCLSAFSYPRKYPNDGDKKIVQSLEIEVLYEIYSALIYVDMFQKFAIFILLDSGLAEVCQWFT